MWIVQRALRRPYTFVVAALALLLLGVVTISRMPTERLFSQVEEVIRRTIPTDELSLVLDNIGLPVGGVNLAFSDSSTIGPSDGEILVALNPEHHSSTWQYVKELRQRLNAQFPHVTFFFQPADIISQILNFGLPAPIDIQVVGRDLQANYAIAEQIEARVARIPGAVDVHVHQIVDAPQLFVNVDRTRAAQMGLTQRDVANNLLVSLSQAARQPQTTGSTPKTA